MSSNPPRALLMTIMVAMLVLGALNAAVRPVDANTAPAFTSADVLSVYLGDTYKYHVTAHDPDGDPLTLFLDIGPKGMTLTDWNLTWAPNATQLGQNPVMLNLSDGKNPAGHHYFNITVLKKNHPPAVKILSPTKGATFLEGDTIHIKGNASDPDKDPLTYSWKIDNIATSTSLTFDSTLPIGTHSISFGVSDGKVTAYDNSTIIVKAKPSFPGHYTTYDDASGFLIAIIVLLIFVVADIVYRIFKH